MAKYDIGDISIITYFNFNAESLYQEDSTIFPDRVVNEKLGHSYRKSLTCRDHMGSWILNDNDELLVWSNVRPFRKMNF